MNSSSCIESSVERSLKPKRSIMKEIMKEKHIYILLLPAFLYFLIFSYAPIFSGFIMSLQDYAFTGDSAFVGLKHYKEILTDTDFWRSFRNTLQIGGGTLFIGFVVQISLAILLNEIGNKHFKKLTQTIIYTPNLFSWVAVGGIWISLLSPSNGLVNEVIKFFGMDPINFMTNERIIQPVFIFLNIWRTAGYGCIIFLAALMNIDQTLYEAATIDGAGRIRQTFYITIPSLFSTMKVVFMLNLISVLRMFSQSYILSNPMVIDKTEVAMTYTYKMGIKNFRMDYASAIAFIMLILTCALSVIYQVFIKKPQEE